MAKILILVLMAFAGISFATGASAKETVYVTSKQSAEALCKGHGGGTSCAFCHRKHCHIVDCTKEGTNTSCTNTVYTRTVATEPHHRPIRFGGRHTPAGGTSEPGHHPITGGLRAPTAGLKQTGGSHSSGPILRSGRPRLRIHHSSDKH